MTVRRELGTWINKTLENLEMRRLSETSRVLREYGYPFKFTKAMKFRTIAGIGLIIPHGSFQILYRPPPSGFLRKTPEQIIGEIDEKYEGIFEDLFASKLRLLTVKMTERWLKKLARVR